MFFPSQLLNNVVFVGPIDKVNGQWVGIPKPRGTGFIVGMSTGKVSHRYLVTALHVANPLSKGHFFIRLNMVGGGVTYMMIEQGTRWYENCREKFYVDVAVMPIYLPSHIVYNYLTPEVNFLTDEIINHPHHKIGIGNEVAIAGLYANVIGEERNLPIVRMGNVAMMPEQLLPSNDFGIVEAYLIDGFVTPGMSGSPVFVIEPTYPQTANAYLLGLLHGHVEKPNPIKVPDVIISKEQNEQAEIQSFLQYNINTHLGLSYVVPAKRIWEVLNDDELVEMRNKAEQDAQ
jgi:hypothetical protein